MRFKQLLTPSQTVGPFFHPTLLRTDAFIDDLVSPDHPAQPVIIEGYVLDGAGDPVPDAGIELWQADERGCYLIPDASGQLPSGVTFTGYGRTGTDDSGHFRFRTVKPGRVPFDTERMQAPHICVTVYARGLLNHLVTRIYFGDEAANKDDPILRVVPVERRETLIATRSTTSEEGPSYRFDITLQGERETVFFDV